MDAELIMILVNAGLAVIGIVLGTKWAKGKGKINQAIDVAVTVMRAIEDDKVSPEEEKVIVAKIRAMLPGKEA